MGTSRYTELTQVPAAANSLESMRRLLAGPLCAWPTGQITVVPEQELPGDLPDQLVELFGQVRDVALFYYVGHGQVDFEDQLCLGLVRSRVQSERRATTSLTFEAVRRALRASPAATKVVILDCCFAGHAVHGPHTLAGQDTMDITGLASATGAYTLAATGPANTAWFESDADSVLPHTHFTRSLVDIVERGIPGEATELTLEPIYHRLHEALHTAGKPAPTRSSRDLAGAFVFARNAAPRPPAPTSVAIPPAANLVHRYELLNDAEQAARAIVEPADQCAALILIAEETAQDDPDRARRLLDDAERITGAIEQPRPQTWLWRSIAAAVVADDPGRARRLLDAFERAVNSTSIQEGDRDRLLALTTTPPALFRLDPDRAARLGRSITDPALRGYYLADAARAVAARDPDLAERLARNAPDVDGQARALLGVVRAVITADPDRAERIARSIADTSYRSTAFARIAAATGPHDPDRGRIILGEAERTARRGSGADTIARDLKEIVEWLADGHHQQAAKGHAGDVGWLRLHAERITREIDVPRFRVEAAISAAGVMLPAESRAACRLLIDAVDRLQQIQDRQSRDHTLHLERDVVIVLLPLDPDRAMRITERMPRSFERDQADAAIVSATAPNDPDRAEHIAHHIADPALRAPALATIAQALTRNNPAEANTLLTHARRVARAAGPFPEKARTVIGAIVATYDPDLAISILAEDGDTSDQSEGLLKIAETVAKDTPDRAADIARAIPNPTHRHRALISLARLYTRDIHEECG